MSLASAMQGTGLNEVLAGKMENLMVLPTMLLLIAVVGLVIFITEVVSNTATTAAVLPVLFGLGTQIEGGPLQLVVPATLAASCAFMFPVSTPPNAVVYGSGRIPMPAMMKYGFCLNLIGMILIPLMVAFTVRLLAH